MKTLKTLFATALVLGFALNVNAQYNGDVTATASASVNADYNIIKLADIAYGDVGLGVTATLDPVTGTVVNGGLNSTTHTIGRFQIEGADNGDATISWTNTALEGAGDPIPYTPQVSYSNSTGDAALSGGDVIDDGDTENLSANGQGWIYVGGNIEVATNQASGTYEGTFTLTVEFN